jgi:hypothetical protein
VSEIFKVEGEEKYLVKISNRFAVLENLDAEVYITNQEIT